MLKPNELIRKAECQQCGGITNCDIRGKHSVHYDDDYPHEDITWYILQCCGCEHVFMQTVRTNEMYYDECDDDCGKIQLHYHEKVEYWPPFLNRKEPNWLKKGADRLDVSLNELYRALNNDLNMLAAIGIRTTFEIAAEVLSIEAKTFRGKLERLEEEGHIDRVDKARLEVLVDAGNASAHRGWRPDTEELNAMMDVLEHFIHDRIVAPARKSLVDEKLDKMKKTIPPREGNANKSGS